MPALLVVALVVVPLVELYVLIQVGQVAGVGPTLLLLVAMSLLGAYLLRREGTKTWRAFRTAMGSGRLPAKEVADGALVIFGGALLLTPGFATDLFGLLCVLPPTRAALRRVLTGLVAKRLGVAGMVGGLAAERLRRPGGPADPAGSGGRGGAAAGGAPWGRRGAGDVVDGEVVDGGAVDEPGRPPGTLPPA